MFPVSRGRKCSDLAQQQQQQLSYREIFTPFVATFDELDMKFRKRNIEQHFRHFPATSAFQSNYTVTRSVEGKACLAAPSLAVGACTVRISKIVRIAKYQMKIYGGKTKH